MYYVQIHHIFSVWNTQILIFVINYKKIPIVNASKAISFNYDLIFHYDYLTDKSFASAEI